MNKEKAAALAAAALVVVGVFLVQAAVSDVHEVPPLPEKQTTTPYAEDVPLALLSKGEFPRLWGEVKDVRNPWERFEGLVRPEPRDLPLAAPPPPAPWVLLPSPSCAEGAPAETRPASLLGSITVLDQPPAPSGGEDGENGTGESGADEGDDGGGR